MKDAFDDNTEQAGPEDLVTAAFSRCSNWPKTREGLLGLAQGLKRASDASGIAMDAILARCALLSQFCPTDFDLDKVAKEMAIESQPKAPSGCAICRGSGWESFQKHVDPLNTGVGYMADYARHCSCARGQWMAAQERRRKEEAAAKKRARGEAA